MSLPTWTRGALPKAVDVVVASGAAGVGPDPAAVGVVYFAVSLSNGHNPPLMVVDWDLSEVTAGTLNRWVPQVFERLLEWGHATESLTYYGHPDHAISQSLMMEPLGVGEMIAETSCDRYFVDILRNEKILAMEMPQRAIAASAAVNTQWVKFTDEAHEKLVAYKGTLYNHLERQVQDFGMEKSPNDAGVLLVSFANMVNEIFSHPRMRGRMRWG